MLNGETTDLIDESEFPMTSEQFVERYGDHEFELPNGSETLREVIQRTDSETYQSPDDARLSLYNSLSSKAIGRKGYSDRDPTPPGSPYGPDQISF
ncbi:DUF2795 domain-containing protein [Halostella sp. JP-L12]|uniref:DUF5789 family protein n=1 Tax=Halostella TaxID=1843185 RepID=UPI000EF7C2D7|nr:MULTISPECIES: DUF2795 domain-containing protein [Halostella]NHN46067.1 DUF2795 domain-containing protein [Halostella sp. JP-L12]